MLRLEIPEHITLHTNETDEILEGAIDYAEHLYLFTKNATNDNGEPVITAERATEEAKWIVRYLAALLSARNNSTSFWSPTLGGRYVGSFDDGDKTVTPKN